MNSNNYYIKLFSLILITSFLSCSTSDSESDNLKLQYEKNIIGDWVGSIGEAPNAHYGNQVIYRFQEDGNVLIGILYDNGQDNRYLPEYRYNSIIKFYYKSTWEIKFDDLLSIDGDIFWMSNIPLYDLEPNTLTLKNTLHNPKDNNHYASYPRFTKRMDIKDHYEKVMDLTNLEIEQTTLSGLWIPFNGYWNVGWQPQKVAYELNNGIIIKNLGYDIDNQTFTDFTDPNHLSSRKKYTISAPEFPGQILNRVILEYSGISSSTNLPQFNTIKIADISIDDSGQINIINFTQGSQAGLLSKRSY